MYFLEWSCEDVAEWIQSLGYPQYTECFTENFITGKKLIYVNCRYLPQLGITDFEHMKEKNGCLILCAKHRRVYPDYVKGVNICNGMGCISAHRIGDLHMCKETIKTETYAAFKVISAHVRELLAFTEPPWSQSIADPPRDNMGMFLELKSRTGKKADALTYTNFLESQNK